MTTTTAIQSIPFASLPAQGADLGGGIFAGLTTQKDGTHTAIVRLPGHGVRLNHQDAKTDAEKRGGRLPTKAEAALITTNLTIERGWYWTGEDVEGEPSFAWYFNSYGTTHYGHKSAQGGALAVRSILITG